MNITAAAKEGAQTADHAAASGRTRVLVLASTFPRWHGDSEPPFVYNLCRGLQDAFDLTVLVPHAPGAARSERMDGLAVYRFRYFWPERWQRLAYGGILPNLKRNRWLWAQVPFFLAAELVAAVRLIRRDQIDVIHAHWVLPQGLVAAIAGAATHRPVVVTAHGGDVYGLRGKLQGALKRWILARTARVTAVSQDLARAITELTAAHPVNVDVVSMGVDTTCFRALPASAATAADLGTRRPLILFVGRLAEKKGLRYLLDAMPAVLARHPDATLAVVGDGPLRDSLALQARDLGLEHAVRFLGARAPDQLPRFYSAASVFAGPSIVAHGGDTESFGLVFAEAMACGCPVVASDVGGISDLVQHEVTGLLVPQRDPAALAAAICRVLDDAPLRRRLKRNALAHIRRDFTQAAIAGRYGAILQEAAA